VKEEGEGSQAAAAAPAKAAASPSGSDNSPASGADAPAEGRTAEDGTRDTPDRASESAAERRSKRAARRAAAVEARRARRAAGKKPADEKEAVAATAEPAATGPEPGSNFDRQAAQNALAAAADQAKNCRPIGGPSGSGTVQVQYEPSGKVSAVTVVTPGFENSEAGSCIQMLFRRARVPQFSGTKPVTLRQRFEIP
jgi:hypothetical protein